MVVAVLVLLPFDKSSKDVSGICVVVISGHSSSTLCCRYIVIHSLGDIKLSHIFRND